MRLSTFYFCSFRAMSLGYELLYLVPATNSQSEVEEIKNQIGQLLAKEQAEILSHEIWTQRKLAYPIKKAEHAYYVLCYFKVAPAGVSAIKKSILLSKSILRSRVLQHEDLEAYLKIFNERVRLKAQEARKHPASPLIVVEQATPKERQNLDLREPVPAKREISEQPEISLPTETSTPEQEVQKSVIVPEVIVEKKATKAKKSSLADLDKKLEDILGGEIEL